MNTKAPLPSGPGAVVAPAPPQTQKLKSRSILPKQAKSHRFDSTERDETKLPHIFKNLNDTQPKLRNNNNTAVTNEKPTNMISDILNDKKTVVRVGR